MGIGLIAVVWGLLGGWGGMLVEVRCSGLVGGDDGLRFLRFLGLDICEEVVLFFWGEDAVLFFLGDVWTVEMSVLDMVCGSLRLRPRDFIDVSEMMDDDRSEMARPYNVGRMEMDDTLEVSVAHLWGFCKGFS